MTYRARCQARHDRAEAIVFRRWVAKRQREGASKMQLAGEVLKKRYSKDYVPRSLYAPSSFFRFIGVDVPHVKLSLTQEATYAAKSYWERIAMRDKKLRNKLMER